MKQYTEYINTWVLVRTAIHVKLRPNLKQHRPHPFRMWTKDFCRESREIMTFFHRKNIHPFKINLFLF